MIHWTLGFMDDVISELEPVIYKHILRSVYPERKRCDDACWFF